MKVSNSTVLTRFLREKLAPAIQTAKDEPEIFLNRTGQESAEVKLGSDTYEFSFEGWKGGVDTDRSFSSVWALRSRERVRTGFLWRKKQPVREITFAVESHAEVIGAGRSGQYVPGHYRNAVVELSYLDRRDKQAYSSRFYDSIDSYSRAYDKPVLVSSVGDLLAKLDLPNDYDVQEFGRPPGTSKRSDVPVPTVIRDAHAVFENLHKLVYSQALPTSAVEPDLPELKL